MTYRTRRVIGVLFILAAIVVAIVQQDAAPNATTKPELTTRQEPQKPSTQGTAEQASVVLGSLEVKGRAPKTGYERNQFGDGWLLNGGCDMRNVILNRDLVSAVINDRCKVTSGTLNDPYTGQTIQFLRGDTTSDLVQIDHVVALSNAWQTGAQQLSQDERQRFANDPLELLAVDGAANQSKADSDAASWLPANKSFRCQYVARQIAVKKRYNLWVTDAEKAAMARVLSSCAGQLLPS